MPTRPRIKLITPHMAEWLITILLGCIEGITEFLPISSTGHLILAERWLGQHRSDLFNVVIQAGAVLAVIPLFWGRVSGLIYKGRDPEVRSYAAKILLAFGITGVGGVLLEKGGFRLAENPLPVAVALVVGGVFFLIVEHFLVGREGTARIGWYAAIAVGGGQLLAAIFPGASRSGTTILLCLILGISRPAATEFSFLVGIPTMLAASGLKIAKALFRPTPGIPGEDWGEVVLGFLVAAMVSFFVVRWLLGYVRNHSFRAFGWYRIALGLLILALLR